MGVSNVNRSSSNISWQWSYDTSQTYLLTISYGTHMQQIPLNVSNYIFTAPEDTLPCQVYNFSIIATHNGATFTGDDCYGSMSRSEILAVRGDSLGNNNLWREVNLLGELTFKVMATLLRLVHCSY